MPAPRWVAVWDGHTVAFALDVVDPNAWETHLQGAIPSGYPAPRSYHAVEVAVPPPPEPADPGGYPLPLPFGVWPDPRNNQPVTAPAAPTSAVWLDCDWSYNADQQIAPTTMTAMTPPTPSRNVHTGFSGTTGGRLGWWRYRFEFGNPCL